MSKKKRSKKVASKQHGSDRVLIDRESGLYVATAAIHQGRVTTVMQGPQGIEPSDARQNLNDGLYRGGLPKI